MRINEPLRRLSIDITSETFVGIIIFVVNFLDPHLGPASVSEHVVLPVQQPSQRVG